MDNLSIQRAKSTTDGKRTRVIRRSMILVSKIYPRGIQFKNRSSVSRVALISEVFWASSRTSQHSLKISLNSSPS